MQISNIVFWNALFYVSQKKFLMFIEIKKGRYTNPSLALSYFKEEGLGMSLNKNTKMNVCCFLYRSLF